MNQVVPYCECPQCSYWGLHYMAETDVQSYPRVLIVVKPKDVIGQRVVYTKAEWVVRECYNCSHKFQQHWREWNDW